MQPDAKRIRQRHQLAARKRAEVADLLDECYEFAIPLRERIYPSGKRRDTDRLFDATAVDGTEGLASSVLEDVWPTDSRPFELAPGRAVPPAQKDAAARALEALADEVIGAINDSNFRTAAHEALKDWAICDGLLLMDMGPNVDEPFIFTALPPNEYVLGVGPRGAYDQLYRERKVKVGHLPILWPAPVLSADLRRRMADDPDAEVKVLEACWREWGAKEETWRYAALVDGEEGIMASRMDTGPGSCPFLAFSYSRRASETVGRGPVQLALADVRSLNVSVEMLLQNGEMALAGVWTYDDDGVVNPDTITLAPGTLIPKAPGSDGLRSITPSGDFRFAEFLIERLTQKVERALFRLDLGDTRKTPRSATEVLQRTADRSRRLAGGASRLLNELLFPLVRRALWIMGRLGGQRPPRLDGREVRVRALGPITKAQAKQDIVDFDQFMELGNARFGPQPMAVAVDQEKAVPWLAEQFGVRKRLIRDQVQRKQLVEAVQGLAAQAQDAGMLPGGANGGAA